MLRFGAYIPYNATDGNNDAKDQIANDNGPRFAGFNKNDGRIYFNQGTFGTDKEVAASQASDDDEPVLRLPDDDDDVIPAKKSDVGK